MSIGFIGAGKIAQALMKGLVSAGMKSQNFQY
jgi:pyrroline-5-carboxylate reductase